MKHFDPEKPFVERKIYGENFRWNVINEGAHQVEVPRYVQNEAPSAKENDKPINIIFIGGSAWTLPV